MCCHIFNLKTKLLKIQSLNNIENTTTWISCPGWAQKHARGRTYASNVDRAKDSVMELCEEKDS